MVLTAITPLQGTRRRAQQGYKSVELLTLLLTPGRFRANKPSQDMGLRVNDRKSSKQPVVGSNQTGGVSSRTKADAAAGPQSNQTRGL